MRVHSTTVLLTAIALLVIGGMAQAETAAESFTKGETLFTQGDVDGALAAYANAVRADQSNQEYMQHYTILRRIIQLRKNLGEEKEPTRWENTARALHAFYVSQKVYPEALALGRQMHARLNNEWSAITLAETELALSLNAEAVKTLSGLEAEKPSPATQALLGIALVRNGQAEQAKEIAYSLELTEEADAQAVYAAARLAAAVGDSDQALKRLARVLESVPPSRQDGFTEHAKTSPEFAAMASTPEFAKALATESKIAESKCSGGKSCAGCPMRGNCPSSNGK